MVLGDSEAGHLAGWHGYSPSLDELANPHQVYNAIRLKYKLNYVAFVE